MNEVVFGPSYSALTQDRKEFQKLLDEAYAAISDGVLTDWEASFVESSRFNLHRFRNKFAITSARKEIFDRIQQKLEKAGLI